MFSTVERMLSASTDDGTSSLFDYDWGSAPEDIPKFRKEEIRTGRNLGQGSFSDVFDIKRIKTENTNAEEATYSRALVASRCRTCYGETRLALKTSRKDILNQGDIVADLLVETHLLCRLAHPNIITLYGIADSSSVARSEYFIVLDRLHDTLSSRMKNWKFQIKSSKSTWSLPLRRNRPPELLWEERLTRALHLTSALKYMHEECVIHRDIKPDNIGFSIDDEIKLFDLGLSRPVPSTSQVYKLSMAGSPRYMAPEIIRGQPYNQTCDVYSLTVLVWEMLMLERPYGHVKNLEVLEWKVTHKSRPRIPKKWSRSLRELLNAGWEHDQFKRISMTTFHSLLQSELENLTSKEQALNNVRVERKEVVPFTLEPTSACIESETSFSFDY